MLTKEAIEAVEAAGPRESYGEYVRDMAKIGVSRYLVWVNKQDRIFYDENGNELRLAGTLPELKATDTFDSTKVFAAIRNTNIGKTDYPTFLKEIAEAGVFKYDADFKSRKIRYIGLKEEDYYEEDIPV